MKQFLLTAIILTAFACEAASQTGYPITPVSFTQVKVNEASFWGQRLKASREVTIPLALSKCEETNRYSNFSNAAAHMKDTTKVFDVVKNMGFPFDDTDPYKTLEGVSYLLQVYPDKKLDAYADSIIAVIASGQEPDGYLYTARTQNPNRPHKWSGMKRWSEVEGGSHEFYNLGHLCEAAVAHYYATGKRNFLDIAIRYADCVCREVGDKPGQVCVVPGHQIAEMGLCKLYIATGDKKYLDQAKFFLDKRGYTRVKNAYSQSHKPVLEQDEAVGHAVRAGYMYAGMADVAALTKDEGYIRAIDKIWENIVTKKFYITGGVGARHDGEAFGSNYELPNLSAYCETCAAIANVYFNYRLFLLHGESKYYDALERSLYNAVISGISLDGGKFFYPNPLASDGNYERQAWFGCACCPSNVARFIPSLPQYMYAVKDDAVYVNLYNSSTANLQVNGKKVIIEQETNYPWDGNIALTIKTGGNFKLKVRVPGWAKNEVVPSDLYAYSDGVKTHYYIYVNGQKVSSDEVNSFTPDGYCTIDRKWKRGDRVTICLDMPLRKVEANKQVKDDDGLTAVERGPIVYCWEDGTDSLPEYGIKGLQYKNMTLIPYFAWAHKGKRKMAVWLE
ncbi:MAG: glycoside hydrolase family 127 protein [Prevotellaceae bacterium]|nr:glycoside hydrolase family 127 protein [Prevotellaceae bacterium]